MVLLLIENKGAVVVEMSLSFDLSKHQENERFSTPDELTCFFIFTLHVVNVVNVIKVHRKITVLKCLKLSLRADKH